MRHDKLREQGGQKDNAFRVGQVDENRAEQFSAFAPLPGYSD
jgi:hypothetical protein